VQVVGPLWDVGTRDLRVFLVETSDGLILIGGVMPGSEGVLEDAIRAAGFDPADIRILLSTHAHVDHAGTLASFKASTGASLQASAADAALLESGGAADYLFANVPGFRFDPVRADRVLRDGDQVSLGGVTLTARLTPGHTPGNTTWVMELQHGRHTWHVVITGSASVNPGTRFLREPSYPGILEDYRRSIALLESLDVEIWLAPHASQCGFEAKRERARFEGPRAFVDPEGYRAQVARWKAALERAVAEEQTGGA
jgi:metallo-beta-lactamase class B